MGAIEKTLEEIREIVAGGTLLCLSHETNPFKFAVIYSGEIGKSVIVEVTTAQWRACEEEFSKRAEAAERRATKGTGAATIELRVRIASWQLEGVGIKPSGTHWVQLFTPAEGRVERVKLEIDRETFDLLLESP